MTLPHARLPIAGDALPSRPWFTWFQSVDRAIEGGVSASTQASDDVTLIATALGSPTGLASDLPSPLLNFGSAGSIAAVQNGNNAWFITLKGDAQNPGNTYYYGTGATGIKGWFDLCSAVTIYADTAPDGHAGLKWVDTTTGIKYDWYVDADGGQWVEFGPESGTGGGGYPEGTENPVTPVLNEKFYRTDRNLLIYYDGAQWVTTNEYSMQWQGSNPAGSFASGYSLAMGPVQEDIYITSVQNSTRVVGTNNSSNYWNITYSYHDGAASTTAAVLTTNGLSFASPNLFVLLSGTVDAVAHCRNATVTFTSVGSPGTIYVGARINYRLVVT